MIYDHRGSHEAESLPSHSSYMTSPDEMNMYPQGRRGSRVYGNPGEFGDDSGRHHSSGSIGSGLAQPSRLTQSTTGMTLFRSGGGGYGMRDRGEAHESSRHSVAIPPQAHSPPLSSNNNSSSIAHATMASRRRTGAPGLGFDSGQSSGGGSGAAPAVRRLQRSSTLASRHNSAIPSSAGGGLAAPFSSSSSSFAGNSRISPPFTNSITISRRTRTHQSQIALLNYSQRSDKFDNIGADDEDDDLERVVRQGSTSSSGLVNAYGVGNRAGTSRRPAKGRPSLASTVIPKSMTSGFTKSQSGRFPVNSTSNNNNTPPSDLNDRIRVCVRKRPMSRAEVEKGEKDVINIPGRRSVIINEPKVKVDMTRYIEEHHYLFNEVFPENVSNLNVYRRTAAPLVDYFFNGGNATCFTYGQTGSGKTYTMLDTENGLYIQAAKDIFDYLGNEEHAHLRIYVTFYEIYLTNLFDLLNKRKKLFAREDGNQNVVIQGVREVLVDSVEDLMAVFEYGNNARSVGKLSILKMLIIDLFDTNIHILFCNCREYWCQCRFVEIPCYSTDFTQGC